MSRRSAVEVSSKTFRIAAGEVASAGNFTTGPFTGIEAAA